MKKSKILAFVISIMLAVSCFVGCGDDKVSNSNEKKDSTSQTTIKEENTDDGDSGSNQTNNDVNECITFGKYEQDNNEENGKEDIEWLVLERKEGKAFVVSKYALDCKQYNDEYVDVTWETCTLRAWLNNAFINDAFTPDEKTLISTVTVTNNDNAEFKIDGGNDTQDKVFLLSIDEINNYFDSKEERMCGATDYAKAQSAWTDDYYTAEGKDTCWWWLRSPGEYQCNASSVSSSGGFYLEGYVVDRDNRAVRPAMWISIE